MATNVYFETGDNLDETNYQIVSNALVCGSSFVVDGYEVSDSGGTQVDVGAGTAVVNGYVIVEDAAQNNQSCTNNATNYVYLEPDGDLEISTSSTPTDSNSLQLAVVVTSGGSISSITHVRTVDTGWNKLIVKATDEDITSNSTLQDDNELVFTAAVREAWEDSCVLIVDQDGSTANFQCRLQAPSGTVSSAAFGPDDDVYSAATTATGSAGTVGYNHSSAVNGPTHQILHAAMGDNGVVRIEGLVIIGDTGGDVQLQWAQITSNGSATSVNAGSYMIARRIFF